MSDDFLGRLVARETGGAAVVAPLLPTPFLPDGPGPDGTETEPDEAATGAPVAVVGRHVDERPPAPSGELRQRGAVTMEPSAPAPAPIADRPPERLAPPASSPSPPVGAAGPSELVTTAPAPTPGVAPSPGLMVATVTAAAATTGAVPSPAAPPSTRGEPAIAEATGAPAPSAADAEVPDHRQAPPLPPPPIDDAGQPGAERGMQPASGRRPNLPLERAVRPAVRITIGRLEVRAPSPPAPSADGSHSWPRPATTDEARRVPTPSRSLQDYLRERRERR